jgi:death-on-curing protein
VRHLTLGEILTLHERMRQGTGGASGVRDLGALESAVAQPRMTFGGEDLYPDLVTKATALAY